MPQSIYDNGGMIGATLDFGDTDTYPSSGGYDNAISTTSGGAPTFRWSLDGSIVEAGGHTATETGTASFTTGIINGISSQSADFSGSYNLDIDNTGFINAGSQYVFTKRSLSFWFNADSSTGYKAIWEQGGGVNWLVIYLEGGLLYANIGEGSTTGGHATASVSTGQTYHCLVTVDLTLASNQIKIYLNGTLAGQATSTVGTDLAQHSGDVNMGFASSRNHLNVNNPFSNYDGRLQDFCYWFEEALTLSDAQSIYAAGIAPPPNQKNSGIWSLSSVLESIEPRYASMEFVGAVSSQAVNGGSASISLTSLSGGTNSSPQAGDLILVAVSRATTASSTATLLETSGYTQIENLFSQSTYGVQAAIFYKISDGTETSIASVASNFSNDSSAIAAQVWRGASSTSTLIASESLTSNTTGIPPTPSLSLTEIAQVFYFGATGLTGVTAAAPQYFTAGADVLTLTSQFSADTYDSILGIADLGGKPSGVTPLPFSMQLADSTGFSSVGVTFAIRLANV